ncbi:hypothetical protein FISHEDRAFT_56093 [Fistulina hepatica ATCC 64428]|uniref:Ubiquitin-like protease family profile domain-containing protein n=1 Tax=Fistulina hepatica ATCC 64428 TaxID=1128425 RepID=A0A0D7ANK9_9AGAR|nr:hypothetical protein FISHEDRAFT_56093 [Fistulina hepatica ATCC 64428]
MPGATVQWSSSYSIIPIISRVPSPNGQPVPTFHRHHAARRQGQLLGDDMLVWHRMDVQVRWEDLHRNDPVPGGASGSLARDSHYWVVSSPNVDFIPEPLLGKRFVMARLDGRFAADDRTQWPQFFVEGVEWMATMPRPQRDQRAPGYWLHHTLRLQDTDVVDAGVVPIELRKVKYTVFRNLLQHHDVIMKTVRKYVKLYLNNPVTGHPHRVLASFVTSACNVRARLESVAMPWKDLVLVWAEWQCDLLDIHAFIKYAVDIHPELFSLTEKFETDFQRPLSTVDRSLMGCFTHKTNTANFMLRCGIPVWLIRPSWEINSMTWIGEEVGMIPWKAAVEYRAFQDDAAATMYPVLWRGDAHSPGHYRSMKNVSTVSFGTTPREHRIESGHVVPDELPPRERDESIRLSAEDRRLLGAGNYERGLVFDVADLRQPPTPTLSPTQDAPSAGSSRPPIPGSKQWSPLPSPLLLPAPRQSPPPSFFLEGPPSAFEPLPVSTEAPASGPAVASSSTAPAASSSAVPAPSTEAVKAPAKKRRSKKKKSAQQSVGHSTPNLGKRPLAGDAESAGGNAGKRVELQEPDQFDDSRFNPDLEGIVYPPQDPIWWAGRSNVERRKEFINPMPANPVKWHFPEAYFLATGGRNGKDGERTHHSMVLRWLALAEAWFSILSRNVNAGPSRMRAWRWLLFGQIDEGSNAVDSSSRAAPPPRIQKAQQAARELFGCDIQLTALPETIRWRGHELNHDVALADGIPPAIVNELLWFMTEAQWRLELVSLDRALAPAEWSDPDELLAHVHAQTRQGEIQAIWNEQTWAETHDDFSASDGGDEPALWEDFIPSGIPEADFGVVGDVNDVSTGRSLARLARVMKSWPGCPEVVAQTHQYTDPQRLETSKAGIARFYCQSFFNEFGRAPTIPCRVPPPADEASSDMVLDTPSASSLPPSPLSLSTLPLQGTVADTLSDLSLAETAEQSVPRPVQAVPPPTIAVAPSAFPTITAAPPAPLTPVISARAPTSPMISTAPPVSLTISGPPPVSPTISAAPPASPTLPAAPTTIEASPDSMNVEVVAAPPTLPTLPAAPTTIEASPDSMDVEVVAAPPASPTLPAAPTTIEASPDSMDVEVVAARPTASPSASTSTTQPSSSSSSHLSSSRASGPKKMTRGKRFQSGPVLPSEAVLAKRDKTRNWNAGKITARPRPPVSESEVAEEAESETKPSKGKGRQLSPSPSSPLTISSDSGSDSDKPVEIPPPKPRIGSSKKLRNQAAVPSQRTVHEREAKQAESRKVSTHMSLKIRAYKAPSIAALSTDDLNRLLPGQWLSDEIVNFFVNKWSASQSDVHFLSTFFYVKFVEREMSDVEKKEQLARWFKEPLDVAEVGSQPNLPSKGFVIPLHRDADDGKHWRVGRITFGDNTGTIRIYDSMTMFRGLRELKQIAANLMNLMNLLVKIKGWSDVENWNIDVDSQGVPYQSNGVDCGVYSIMYMWHSLLADTINGDGVPESLRIPTDARSLKNFCEKLLDKILNHYSTL